MSLVQQQKTPEFLERTTSVGSTRSELLHNPQHTCTNWTNRPLQPKKQNFDACIQSNPSQKAKQRMCWIKNRNFFLITPSVDRVKPGGGGITAQQLCWSVLLGVCTGLDFQRIVYIVHPQTVGKPQG